MKCEWKTVKIGDLGQVMGGATPSTKDPKNYSGNIPWITPKDLSVFNGRFISQGERNITQKGLESCSTHILPKDSVLFSSRAPIGYMAIAANELCTNQGFKSVIPNSDTDYLFLYYLLQYNKEKIESMGSGTTFKEVSGSTMRNIEVSVPDLVTQKKIAKILSSLDDKIELNNAINHNLQQQAQAFFESLFVSFDGVSPNQLYDSELGAIPKGWEVKLLSEVTTSIRTKVNDNNYKVLSAINTGELKLSEEHFNKQVFSESICNYIVVEPLDFAYNPSRINIGSIGMNAFDFTGCVSPIYVVVRSEPEYHYFLNFFIKSKRFAEEVKTRASGSVRQSLSYTDFGQIKVAYPPISIIKKFNKEYGVRLKFMKCIRGENERLISFRDTLLPRLMNGEIDVSEVEI